MNTTSLKCMFSSMKLDYATPIEIFNQLNKEFHFNIDACANKENAKVSFYFNNTDGLNEEWYIYDYKTDQEILGRVFCNPPYGREITKWIKKGYEEFIKGNCELIVFLIPSRTDTKWWHEYIMKATEIRFVKGRIKFNGKSPAPFPSAVIIYNSSTKHNNKLEKV